MLRFRRILRGKYVVAETGGEGGPMCKYSGIITRARTSIGLSDLVSLRQIGSEMMLSDSGVQLEMNSSSSAESEAVRWPIPQTPLKLFLSLMLP